MAKVAIAISATLPRLRRFLSSGVRMAVKIVIEKDKQKIHNKIKIGVFINNKGAPFIARRLFVWLKR